MEQKLSKKQWVATIFILGILTIALIALTYLRFGKCESCGQIDFLKRFAKGDDFFTDVIWACKDCTRLLKMF